MTVYGADVAAAADVNGLNTSASALETKAAGRLLRANMAVGQVSITPVANTATSQVVTGLAVSGSSFVGMVTVATTVPGSEVKEAAFSGASATGITVWVYRTNTTGTTVNYLIIGS